MRTNNIKLDPHRRTHTWNHTWRQRGRVVRAPDLKSGGHQFKSRSDHLAGVVSWWTLVQLLGHAYIKPTGLPPANWDVWACYVHLKYLFSSVWVACLWTSLVSAKCMTTINIHLTFFFWPAGNRTQATLVDVITRPTLLYDTLSVSRYDRWAVNSSVFLL